MTEFIKKIKLKPVVDKEVLAKTSKEIQKILPVFKITSDSTIPKMLNTFSDGFSTILSSFDKGFKQGLKDIGTSLLHGFINEIGKAFDEFDRMIDQSFLTNKTTRANVFGYGFSAAESYGFEKTLGVMNIDKDDLMYMNEYQTDMFNKLFKNYTDRYNKLADQGFFEKMQQFQIEEQEFRDNFTYKVMEWVISKKDKIMNFIDLSLTIFDGILDVLSWLSNKLGFGGSAFTHTEPVPVSDIIQNYSGGNTSNTNVNVNNNFNGVDMNNMTDVATTVGLSYEQLVQILLGG